MLKSFVAALTLLAVMASAGLAQASRWDCQMPIKMGNCPVLGSETVPKPVQPNGK